MISKISFYDRFKNRLRNLLYKAFLKKYDFGSRVSKNTWEHQFAKGDWAYLYDKEEAGHYQSIIEMYKEFSNDGSVLDIGCGEAVLYDYFSKANLKPNYLGLDISSVAIKTSSGLFPTVRFKQLDFDKNNLEEKFDVVIFNETLYYFNRPLKKIKQTIKLNLNPNGHLIISMCDSIGHDLIWKRLEENYKVLKTTEIKNAKNQKWRVSLFKPIAMVSSLFLIYSKQGQAINGIADIFCLA